MTALEEYHWSKAHSQPPSLLVTAGTHLVILSRAEQSSKVFIQYAFTFEEVRQIVHPERMMNIGLSTS